MTINAIDSRTIFRLQSCGGTRLTEEEQAAALEAARDLCTARGWDLATAWRDSVNAADAGNDNSPAAARWCEIEDTAIRAATADWARCPDDLSLAPG